MSKLIIVEFSVGNWLNLPASAPTSMIEQIRDKISDFLMKSVSMFVRYFPIRVLAAFSQWVSSENSTSLALADAAKGGFTIVGVAYLMGLTSTLRGRRESFLPQLGHIPLCCCRTSSGGLRSAPSYNVWLHPWQMTRWGTLSLPFDMKNTL